MFFLLVLLVDMFRMFNLNVRHCLREFVEALGDVFSLWSEFSVWSIKDRLHEYSLRLGCIEAGFVYIWASLMAQAVKNPPAMQET